MGTHTAFGDLTDPDNADARHALRIDWIATDGRVTEKGQKELDRRDTARRRLQPGWQEVITTSRPVNGRATALKASVASAGVREVQDEVTAVLSEMGHNGGKVTVKVEARETGIYHVKVAIAKFGPRGRTAKAEFTGDLDEVRAQVAAHPDFQRSTR